MSYLQSRLPPFCYMVRASGLGEVWTHSNDDLKFTQFGWRSTNKENCYSTNTLVGNWNEEKFDITRLQKAKPLPSQYNHYFETTYGKTYDTVPHKVPSTLKNMKSRQAYSFPGHQPELDSQVDQAIYNSYETTSRASYLDPNSRRRHLLPPIEGARS